jgi:hypothetical protein
MIVQRARQVDRSEEFEACCEQLRERVPRLDQVLEGVEWSIMVAPDHWTRVPDTELWLITTDPFPDAPALAIYYTIEDSDERDCTMQRVELADEEPEA